ncbi:DNA sulfur modification protein DndB [uncultured Thiohalocapsa sp.]|uniref:DNA sulfur modification protein DndB n=1 Tax=uncultured Thiohalocapsa sp. TaxID=768990 RepID=UPI0025EEF4C5|nr:DNA sulfur modification protein DndB [uncultured Thiohalocapsa sp.]
MSTDTPATGLPGLVQPTDPNFPNVIDGIYGTFSTPAGSVCYMQTKAKIGGGTSKHAQLTRSLVPAREALNIQEMDFNQLLQRDLDDHRIATKLIPYILDPPANALPGFYPPIVAVLLPFDYNQQPVDTFPPPAAKLDLDHHYGGRFQMTTHGHAYRVQYLANEQGELVDPPIAVLRWNPDQAKLVIMDGQHRAMSLLAIERTVSKSWYTAPKGARYQPFYEEHVEGWLRKAREAGNPVDLSNIELPVTICWFPDEPGQDPRPRPHRAARKLFVDVNNTAKPPSEARLVLLSDTELRNIFARELLNRLRRDERWAERLPLYGVEYDNPIANVSTPKRWSVVTNLEILKDSVVRVVFGPPKLIDQPAASLQGKPNYREMDRFMRQRLEVGKLFPKQFHDGPHRLLRDELGDKTFPITDDAQHQKLLDAFYDRWGRGILWLLSEVLPYRAHLDALQARYRHWNVADNVQILAKDALFEGVGMFWTIADGDQLWRENRQEAKEHSLPEPPQPDISRAWTILEDQERPEFGRLRAKHYLEAERAEDIDDADRLFQGLITYAAQVGLVMAWASLHRLTGPELAPQEVAETLAKAINAALASGPVKTRDRRKIFLKRSQTDGFHPLNELPKLQPGFAVYLRYFWLEVALIDENQALWEDLGIDLDQANDFLAKARQKYLQFLTQERAKQRIRDNEVLKLPQAQQKDKAEDMAKKEIIASQAKAHKYWFGGDIESHRARIAGALGAVERDAETKANDEDDEAEEPDADDDDLLL